MLLSLIVCSDKWDYADSTHAVFKGLKNEDLKGILHPKIVLTSSFTHSSLVRSVVVTFFC